MRSEAGDMPRQRIAAANSLWLGRLAVGVSGACDCWATELAAGEPHVVTVRRVILPI